MNIQDAQAYLDSIAESQRTRLFDMYALGPFLIWAAFASKNKTMGKWPRRLLFTAGAYAIIYNWKNYKSLADLDLTELKKAAGV